MHHATHSRLKCALHFSNGHLLASYNYAGLLRDDKINIVQTNTVKHSSMTDNNQYSDIIISTTCDRERKEQFYF